MPHTEAVRQAQVKPLPGDAPQLLRDLDDPPSTADRILSCFSACLALHSGQVISVSGVALEGVRAENNRPQAWHL